MENADGGDGAVSRPMLQLLQRAAEVAAAQKDVGGQERARPVLEATLDALLREHRPAPAAAEGAARSSARWRAHFAASTRMLAEKPIAVALSGECPWKGRAGSKIAACVRAPARVSARRRARARDGDDDRQLPLPNLV